MYWNFISRVKDNLQKQRNKNQANKKKKETYRFAVSEDAEEGQVHQTCGDNRRDLRNPNSGASTKLTIANNNSIYRKQANQFLFYFFIF